MTHHGGKRKGAGRKAGSSTTKTREIADKALAEGISPLEVMLAAMRDVYAMASLESEQESRIALLSSAANFAKDAAPYVHPKLSAIEHTGKDGKDLIPEMTDIETARRIAFGILMAERDKNKPNSV